MLRGTVHQMGQRHSRILCRERDIPLAHVRIISQCRNSREHIWCQGLKLVDSFPHRVILFRAFKRSGFACNQGHDIGGTASGTDDRGSSEGFATQSRSRRAQLMGETSLCVLKNCDSKLYQQAAVFWNGRSFDGSRGWNDFSLFVDGAGGLCSMK